MRDVVRGQSGRPQEDDLEVDLEELQAALQLLEAALGVAAGLAEVLHLTVEERGVVLTHECTQVDVDDLGNRVLMAADVLHEVSDQAHEAIVGVSRRVAHQAGAMNVGNQLLQFHEHLLVRITDYPGRDAVRYSMGIRKSTHFMPDTILLCPKNDEESLQILKVAEAAKIPTLVSDQPHGARLYSEPNVIARLKYLDPSAKKVVIVEIPGPAIEDELRSIGYEVVIIDHHRYQDLDRMQHLSSLEQFLQVFELDDARLRSLGFDPVLVRGVGMIDRGFVWELKKEGLSKDDQKRIRDHYVDLMHELGSPSTEAVTEAKRAWAAREQVGELLIVKSKRADVKIREALSFVIADEYETPPQVLILEANGRVSLQDSDLTPKFYKAFGGFTFGQDRCWGFAPEPGESAPTLAMMLKVAVE